MVLFDEGFPIVPGGHTHVCTRASHILHSHPRWLCQCDVSYPSHLILSSSHVLHSHPRWLCQCQVLRYGISNKYGAHMDGLGRIMSVLIYLIGEWLVAYRGEAAQMHASNGWQLHRYGGQGG